MAHRPTLTLHIRAEDVSMHRRIFFFPFCLKDSFVDMEHELRAAADVYAGVVIRHDTLL
jgi:hypothetical protein